MATERFDIVVTARGTREVQRDIRRIGTEAAGTRKALAFLRSALVVVASARVIGNLAQQLDLFQELSNRLRLVTNNTRELALVQDALFSVAQRTRADFEGTVIVFQRLAQTTGQLGLEYNELLDLTATVNTAVALSGASAQSASAGLRQFAQALASGVLQGDELRSVVENLPALADLIGKQFGVAGGGLLALNKQTPGIIKLDKIIKALQEDSGELAQTFLDTPRTISQAFTILGNSITFFFGKLSATTGAGRALADILVTIADNIDTVVLALAAFAGVVAINFIIGQLATLNRTLLLVGATGVRAFKAIGAAILAPLRLIRLFALPLIALTVLFVAFREQINAALERLGGFTNIFNVVVSAAAATVRTIVDNFRQLPAAFADIAIQAANKLVEFLEIGVNKAIELLNLLPNVDITPSDLGRIPNKFEGAATQIKDIFIKNYEEIKESDPFEFSKEKLEELQAFLKQFTTGGVNEAAIRDLLTGLTPKAGGAGAFEGVDKALEKLGKKLDGLVSRISPAARGMVELEKATKILEEAQKAGIDTVERFGLTHEEVMRRIRRDLAGVGNDATDAAEKQRLVQEALKNSAITAEEAARRARDIQIELLEGQFDITSGFERAFLKLQKDSEDVASGIEEAMNRAFKGAEDAVVEFVQKGKFSFSTFLADIEEQLLRSAVRALLANLGAQIGIGEAPKQTLLGQIFGGDSGGGGGGGLFSGIGNFFSGLLGAQNGADFTVGPGTSLGTLSGVDNRLIAFRAKDGENVKVTPKGQSSGNTQVVFNITTPDADSFRRSQGQIFTDAQVALNRAAARNG